MRSLRSVSCVDRVADGGGGRRRPRASRSLADSAALTPSRATPTGVVGGLRGRGGDFGAGLRGVGGRLDGLAGGFDAADLALGAVGDLGDGGGDLGDGAAGLVGRGGHLLRSGGDGLGLLGQLGHRLGQLGAHLVVGVDRLDGVVADRADGLGDVADLVVGLVRCSSGVTGDDRRRSGHRRRRARARWRRSVVQWSRSIVQAVQDLLDGLVILRENQNAIANPAISAANSRQQCAGTARPRRPRRSAVSRPCGRPSRAKSVGRSRATTARRGRERELLLRA